MPVSIYCALLLKLAASGLLSNAALRLEAAGLSAIYTATNFRFKCWVRAGEGDIEAIVAGLVADLQREVELSDMLQKNSILHMRQHEQCGKYIRGELAGGTTAVEVVAKLLHDLQAQDARCRELSDRWASCGLRDV